MFEAYFKIGWAHIINWQAYDHLLFIMALSAIYTFADWRQVLVLVTAFTVGHSLTLVLSVLNIVKFPQQWTEFLIPCTIAIAALTNIFQKKTTPKNIKINYWLALVFGVVHGMAFANGLTSLLGKSGSVLMPLLGFNLGVELGQIAFVFSILLLALIGISVVKINRREWVLFLSGGAFFSALIMAVNRWPG